jgi:hypothetical protein
VSFEARIADDPPTVLVAEQLRDGRLALGTRIQNQAGDWKAGELHLLEPGVILDFSAWLAGAVERGWLDTVRERQIRPLRTAEDLYGEGPGAIMQLAQDTLGEIPPTLLRRAMILLANAIGPEARQRLVERLNETESRSEDLELRRQLADEHEALGYAVAAAALYDALARGVLLEDIQDDSSTTAGSGNGPVGSNSQP